MPQSGGRVTPHTVIDQNAGFTPPAFLHAEASDNAQSGGGEVTPHFDRSKCRGVPPWSQEEGDVFAHIVEFPHIPSAP